MSRIKPKTEQYNITVDDLSDKNEDGTTTLEDEKFADDKYLTLKPVDLKSEIRMKR